MTSVKTLAMRLLNVLFLLLFSVALPAQTLFRVMSYNVENLFDTTDNPEKEDNEFLPSGVRYWTSGRYYHKLQQIAKVINAAGEWSTPALVGLCEVENDSVIHHLLSRTPLREQHYRYCITHSPDPRGINVALLYQRDKFGYIGHKANSIIYSRPRHKRSRDILHVWGQVTASDTLDVFICHFPSRYGGEKESETDRFDAARTLKRLCDSLCCRRLAPHILIMGDFNDTPDNKSMHEILSARFYDKTLTSAPSNHLYNLFSSTKAFNPSGSHKYQGEWSQLDQIIVNGTLLNNQSPMRLLPESIRIYAPSFLLTKDKTWLGQRPFRTYYGFKYERGFSDHLPLLTDFIIHLSPPPPFPSVGQAP